jgi:hypothetical protein
MDTPPAARREDGSRGMARPSLDGCYEGDSLMKLSCNKWTTCCIVSLSKATGDRHEFDQFIPEISKTDFVLT